MRRDFAPDRPPPRLTAFGFAVAALGSTILLVVPLVDAGTIRTQLWAFDHLRDTPLGVRAALAALLFAAAIPSLQTASARWLASLLHGASAITKNTRSRLALGIAAGIILLLAFRTFGQRNFALGDGAHLIRLLTLAVHTHGYHLTYDEPLEFYAHSIVYRELHEWWGASVQDAYALLSSLAGVGYAAALVAFWRRRARSAARAACGIAIVASAATTQLFFGYVENYALVTLGLVVYVCAAGQVLGRRAHPAAAAGVLGTCMAFHVLAGWMLPSLAYLAWHTTRGLPPGPRGRALFACGAALLAPIAGTVALCTTLGVPLDAMRTTHLAHLKFIFLIPPGSPAYQYPAFSGAHLRDLANELLLVSLPGLLTLAGALLAGIRADAFRDSQLRVLVLAAVFAHVFAATWNSEIGAYRDWDLFSLVGLFDALVGAYVLLRYVPSRAGVIAVALPVLVLASGLTASWVASNAHRAVNVPSYHDDAHVEAALLHSWAGDAVAARRDLDEVIQIDGHDPHALFELGTLLWGSGERTIAMPLLRRFLEVEPSSDRADQVRRALERSGVGFVSAGEHGPRTQARRLPPSRLDR